MSHHLRPDRGIFRSALACSVALAAAAALVSGCDLRLPGLGTAALADSGPLPVVFVAHRRPASLPADERAALAWARSREDLDLRVVQLVDLAGARIPEEAVLWWHYAEATALPSAAVDPGTLAAVRRHLDDGGGVVLSLVAASWVVPLGLESAAPDTVGAAIPAPGAAAGSRGLQSRGGHPALRRFWGGVDLRRMQPGESMPASFYSGDRWPEEGRVWAVEKRDGAAVPAIRAGIEYPPTPERPGTLITAGAHLRFGAPTDGERFRVGLATLDLLAHAAGRTPPLPTGLSRPGTGRQPAGASPPAASRGGHGRGRGSPLLSRTTWWERASGPPVRRFAPEPGPSLPDRVDPGTPRRPGEGLAVDPGESARFTLAGTRAVARVTGRGRVEALWTHPQRLLADLRFGVVRPGEPVAWLDAVGERRLVLRPGIVELEWSLPARGLEVVLELAVPPGLPALVARLRVGADGPGAPVDVVAAWEAAHGPGWLPPGSAGLLLVGRQERSGAATWRDPASEFHALAGFSRRARRSVVGYQPWRHLGPGGLQEPAGSRPVDDPLGSASVALQARVDPEKPVVAFVVAGERGTLPEIEETWAALLGEPATAFRRAAAAATPEPSTAPGAEAGTREPGVADTSRKPDGATGPGAPDGAGGPGARDTYAGGAGDGTAGAGALDGAYSAAARRGAGPLETQEDAETMGPQEDADTVGTPADPDATEARADADADGMPSGPARTEADPSGEDVTATSGADPPGSDAPLRIRTDDPGVDEALRWARAGLRRLRAVPPGAEAAVLAAAHRSGVSDLGASALWGVLAANDLGEHEVAVATLRHLAGHQDPDGRIPGRLLPLGPSGSSPEAGTPLFVVAVEDTVRATGDVALAEELWPAVEAALAACAAADRDGDGLLDHLGEPAPPLDALDGLVADVSLAGLHAAAVRAAARIALARGDSGSAASLEARAAALRQTLNEGFWDGTARYHHLGRTSRGPVRLRTAFPALPLALGVLNPGEGSALLEPLASAGMTTDWGVAWLDRAHVGAEGILPAPADVWPLHTGWTALAEYRAHRPVPAWNHLAAQLDLLAGVGRLPERLRGDLRVEPAEPVETMGGYALSMVALLRGTLGIRADAIAGTLQIVPHLPAGWESVSLEPLRVGPHAFRVLLQRTENTLVYTLDRLAGDGSSPPVDLFLGARVPGNVPVNLDRDLLRGAELVADEYIDSSPFDRTARVRVRPSGDRSVVAFRYGAHPGLIVDPALPAPGGASTGLRVGGVTWRDDRLSFPVEGLPGRDYVLRLATPWPVDAVGGVPGASVPVPGPGTAEIRFTIPGSGERHRRVELEVTFRR